MVCKDLYDSHSWSRAVLLEAEWWQYCVRHSCNAQRVVEVEIRVVKVLREG